MATSALAAFLVYNTPELMHSMVDQLGYSCCIIDNGSKPPVPFRETMMRITFGENEGFTAGWNKAMRLFQGLEYKYVWMLNSDVQGVSPDMMAKLVQIMEWSHDGLLAVSPAYNSPHQHMHAYGDTVKPVDWLDWAGPLVNVNLFLELGGFDEDFTGYGCDLDLCKRAQARGLHLAVDQSLQFTHLGGLSEDTNGHRSVEKMNQLLAKKYGVKDWTEMF
jgi:GT2 family glycosyltransferase